MAKVFMHLDKTDQNMGFCNLSLSVPSWFVSTIQTRRQVAGGGGFSALLKSDLLGQLFEIFP